MKSFGGFLKTFRKLNEFTEHRKFFNKVSLNFRNLKKRARKTIFQKI